ncbi:MAG: hypothetical protein R3C16_10175 [Hyphomonadaceae bacterium]
MTKGFSFYVFDLSISYSSDIVRALEVMKQVGDEMQKDELPAPLILEPIEIFGVDSLADPGVMLKARFKTQPDQAMDGWPRISEAGQARLRRQRHRDSVPAPQTGAAGCADSVDENPPARGGIRPATRVEFGAAIIPLHALRGRRVLDARMQRLALAPVDDALREIMFEIFEHSPLALMRDHDEFRRRRATAGHGVIAEPAGLVGANAEQFELRPRPAREARAHQQARTRALPTLRHLAPVLAREPIAAQPIWRCGF